MAARRRIESATLYLNVDVEVVSRSPLTSLVSALGRSVFVLYAGPISGGHGAYFQLASSHGRSADFTVKRLATLISRLPASERKVWRLARSRTFDLGIQGGLLPRSHQLAISPGALAQLGRLNAQLVCTTYGARTPPTFRPPRVLRPVPPNNALQRTRYARR